MDTEEKDRFDDLLLRANTLYCKIHPKTPQVYKGIKGSLQFVQQILEEVGHDQVDQSYKNTQDYLEYQKLLQNFKPKQEEIIETYATQFMQNAKNEKELIKNFEQNQEDEIFDRMKEAQHQFKTSLFDNDIDQFFINHWSQRFDKFKKLYQDKEDNMPKNKRFMDSFKIAFENSIILDSSSIQKEFYDNINQNILEYAIYKNNFNRKKQQQDLSRNNDSISNNNNNFSRTDLYKNLNEKELLERQYNLVKRFVDNNKNENITYCLSIIQEQIKNMLQSKNKNDKKKKLIEASCNILQNNFLLKKMKNQTNIQYSYDIPNYLRQVDTYIQQEYFLENPDQQQKSIFINQIPLYALIYFSLRAGLQKEVKMFLNKFEGETDQNFSMIKSFIDHDGLLLEEYKNDYINNKEYCDAFQNLLYFIYGQIQIYEELPFVEMWDYLWIWLKRCYYQQDYKKELFQFQQNIQKEQSDNSSINFKLSIYCFSLQYKEILNEMLNDNNIKFQEVKLIDEDKINLDTEYNFKEQYINFIKKICEIDSLQGLAYLSCFENINTFTQLMFQVFKNNEDLLNKFYNSTPSSKTNLINLKKMFDQNKLNYFYGSILRNYEEQEKFYKPLWYVVMLDDKKEYDTFFKECANANAVEIQKLLILENKSIIPIHYQETIKKLNERLKQIIVTKKYQSINYYIDAYICRYIRNLVKQYSKKKLNEKEFIQKIRESNILSYNLNDKLDITIYVFVQVIKLTLKCIKNRLNSNMDKLSKRSIYNSMKEFTDEIQRFLDQQLRPISYLQKVDNSDKEIKKNVEDIDQQLLFIRTNFLRI